MTSVTLGSSGHGRLHMVSTGDDRARVPMTDGSYWVVINVDVHTCRIHIRPPFTHKAYWFDADGSPISNDPSLPRINLKTMWETKATGL